MSQSQQVASPLRVPPAEAFDQLIWTNPGICSECFARCKTIDEATSLRNKTRTYHERTQSGTLGRAADDTNLYGYRPIIQPRTTCADCGSIRLLCQTDDFSKREMKARVPALVDRLREHGIEVNVAALYLIVEKGKSRERLQGRDRELFATAVAFGIKHA